MNYNRVARGSEKREKERKRERGKQIVFSPGPGRSSQLFLRKDQPSLSRLGTTAFK